LNDIIIIDGKFSNYVLPKIKQKLGSEWLTNGEKNSFFTYIYNRYDGSAVNSAIINSFVKYIYGDGLIDENGIDLKKYISKKDLRLIALDFKMYGQYSIQIKWSQGSTLLGVVPKPVEILWKSTAKFALNLDTNGDVNGYWFSKDWSNINQYKPQFFKKFDGKYDEQHPTEVLTINRVSTQDYYPNPDYTSVLQWAFVDEELTNTSANYITNGMSAGKIVNCIGGKIPTDEGRQLIKNKIIENLTGSTNTNKVIVNFSDGLDGNSITVENIEISNLDQTMVYYSTECANKLFIGHGVTNPSLFGVIAATGFSSASDDRITSIQHLMQSNINPMREEIIDGLESVLKISEPTISLKFKDFDLNENTVIDKNNPPKSE
jgi:hypothetical protein